MARVWQVGAAHPGVHDAQAKVQPGNATKGNDVPYTRYQLSIEQEAKWPLCGAGLANDEGALGDLH